MRVPLLLTRFLKNHSGGSAIEYAILSATISVMLIATFNGVGMNLAASLAKSALLSLGSVFGM